MAEPGEELDPDEPFQKKFFRRVGDPGMPFVERNIGEDAERLRDLQGVGGTDLPFEPRPEYLTSGRITDERGATLPELNLKAQFIKSRNLWDPEFGEQPLSPLGATVAPRAPVRPGAPLTPYERKRELPNNTPLAPLEQKEYDRWARGVGKNPRNEERDYDLRGYWKDVVHGNPDLPEYMKGAIQYHRDQASKLGPNAHLPDMYKKPNHPTFSDESIYHGTSLGGEEPNVGGHWDEEKKTFTPARTNQIHWPRSKLQHYFDKREKGYTINFPDWYK